MILTADYHTHTPYSHGKNTVEENATRAKELGLKAIGIADHGYSHLAFGLSRRKTLDYRKECEAASNELKIDVLVGIESNIRGLSGQTDLTERDYENFDIFLCGKHVMVKYSSFPDYWRYGLGNLATEKSRKIPSEKLVKANTEGYINAVKKNPVDILTHLNFRCPANALEVAKCCADYGTYIELNSKKIHLTDEELTEIVAKTSARFVVNSDAHSASRIADKAIVEEQLERIGFPLDRIDNIEGRLPSFRFAEFKKRKV